jgi:hypothetical protein
MAQLFPPSANAWARASIVLLVGAVVTVVLLAYGISDSAYFTRQEEARHQPISFSHRHHVESMGIECRYCHFHVEESSFAGIPPTHTCMTCHSQIWSESDYLKPVRDSYENEDPIEWTRVHDLPDFVYFNHSIHVKKGVGCVSCHGRIDDMAAVYQAEPLNMGWCLDCHRNPEPHLRPRDQITNMGWRPRGVSRSELGARLAEAYDVNPQDNCYTCHR